VVLQGVVEMLRHLVLVAEVQQQIQTVLVLLAVLAVTVLFILLGANNESLY
jgi:hypothetical protein